MDIEAYRPNYPGYKELDSQRYLQMLKDLGIELGNPPRIFALTTQNLLKLSLRALLCDSPHLGDFTLHQNFYGASDYDYRQIFTREEDVVTALHELTHFWEKDNFPGLYQTTSASTLRKTSPQAPFIQLALREGAAQWVAVQGGLRWEDSTVAARAIRTHNLMTIGKRREDQIVANVQAITQEYAAHLPQDPSIRWNRYLAVADNLYEPLAILGYLYMYQNMLSNGQTLRGLLAAPPQTLVEMFPTGE